MPEDYLMVKLPVEVADNISWLLVDAKQEWQHRTMVARNMNEDARVMFEREFSIAAATEIAYHEAMMRAKGIR